MLDYTILNKDEKNFTKNITIFNIKSAVNEIIATLEDKITMKEIKVDVKLKGFKKSAADGKYLVKSDKKRIQ